MSCTISLPGGLQITQQLRAEGADYVIEANGSTIELASRVELAGLFMGMMGFLTPASLVEADKLMIQSREQLAP